MGEGLDAGGEPTLKRGDVVLELPTEHRVPLGWLLEHGNESIKLRAHQEFGNPNAVAPELLAELSEAALATKTTQAILKRQKDSGVWGGNLLAVAPSAKDGIKEIGTVAQHRRLLQLGIPLNSRAFKLSERLLFRLLSRDEDPELLFEYQKVAKEAPEAIEWGREHFREAAAAALAESGFQEDPRIRGAAHRIASNVSQFLRSPLAEKPLTRAGGKNVLDPEAHPPSWYSIAMIAAMPNLQRERAGFIERLGQFLAQPAPKKAYAIAFGKKSISPAAFLLGDPVDADAKGNPKDLPLALYFIELLARLGVLHTAPTATKVLARLLSECDEQGIWSPRTLKAQPKPGNHITYHWYPLHAETKAPESRALDVTLRLAQIAKYLGWQLHLG